MLIKHRKAEQGDTLIEVLVAIAILGAIIAISYTVMSRGFASAQNALDRTNTQAIMNGQAAMLRAAQAAAMRSDDPAVTKAWADIKAKVPTNTLEYAAAPPANSGQIGAINASGCISSFTPGASNRHFFMDPTSAQVSTNTVNTTRVGTVPKAGDGIWIEGHTYTSGSPNQNVYVFYIKACWNPVYGEGSDVKSEAKTVVRLYAPAN